MEIAGYLKTSLIEWPGKISSVIFTQGCNFGCPFCHNADLVGDKIGGLPRIDEEQILADLKNRKKWVDAVVITGGEPTLQADISRFLSRLKQMGFLVMLETNGTKPDVLKKIINYQLSIINYITMDLKGDLENYQEFTNVQFPITKIKESMEIIIKSGIEYEFRTTVVPGLHNLENLKRLANQISIIAAKQHSNKEKISEAMKLCGFVAYPRWFLQQFRPMNTLDPKFMKIEPYSKKEMEGFQKELKKIIPQTFLRGV